MTNLPKTKKLLFYFSLALLITGGFFVLSASQAKAFSLFGLESIANNVVYSVIGLIIDTGLKIANIFVQIAATLLEFTFSIERFTNVPVVTAGWQICRDLANIGFALVLLVMAFDSVLQLNQYPIKSVLPRLVVAALLINFSMVFCGMIIDFSQVVTHYFYDAAVGTNTAGLSGQIAGALNIQSIYREPSTDWGKPLKDGSYTNLIFGGLFGIAILTIAAFSIAAAAIYFIVRMVTLWALMIFAPLAWVAMIVPNAPEIGGYWNKWWGEFLKWAFFAPVYMFFIYLAILLASATPLTSSSPAFSAQNTLMKAGGFSGFLRDGIYKLLQYIAIILILLRGLKYASSSSVAFSGAVMKAGGSATNWAKNKAKKYTVDKAIEAGKWGLNKAEAGAAKLAAVNVGGPETRFSGRMRAKAEQIRQRGFAEREKTEGNQAYGKLIDTMSEKDLMNEVSKGSGMKKLIAARKAKEKGLLEKGPQNLKKIDKKDYADDEEGKKKYEADLAAAEVENEKLREQDRNRVKEARDVFNSYGIKDDKGKTKEAKELEEMRFDILDEKDQAAVIRRAKENGNLDKIKPVVTQNAQAMDAIVKELAHEFDDVYKKWGKQAKDSAKEALERNLSKGEHNRRAYASVTGDLTKAFGIKKDADGKVIEDGGFEEMRKYIDGMTSAKVSEIKDPKREEDIKLIGQYAKASLAEAMMRERGANASQKEAFISGAKNNIDDAAREFIKTNPGAGRVAYEAKGINEARARKKTA